MSFVKEDLAREVCQVLDLPYMRRHGKGYDIVGAILDSIVGGLLRGERVIIDGFGIFEIRTRPPRKRLAYFYPYLNKKGLHKELQQVPAKRHVVFSPSKPLKRMLNERNDSLDA